MGLETVRMPAPPRWSRVPHVGISLLALSAGAGELYAWPRIHALAGLQVAWLLIPAAIIQIPILVECQRVAITTGQSFIAAIATSKRRLALLTLILVWVSFFWLGGWISGSAYGFWLLLKTPHFSVGANTLIWSLILMAVSLAPFLLGRSSIQRYLHRILSGFAVLTFVMCLLVLILDTAGRGSLPRFARAMVEPHEFPPAALSKNLADLITAITFMGMGGWACIMYTSLSSLARYGLAGAKDEQGAYYLRHATGLRGEDSPKTMGPVALELAPGPESHKNYRGWMRLSWFETTLGVVGNLFTTAILSFLAFSMLYGTDKIPGASWDLLSAQSEFFRPVLGGAALAVFVLLGASFLLDTWIGFGTLLAQISSETLARISPRAGRANTNRLFYSFLILIVIQTVITIVLKPPGTLIRITAVCMNISTPLLCGLLFYLNYWHLPRVMPSWVRPSKWSGLALGAVATCYLLLTVWYLASI